MKGHYTMPTSPNWQLKQPIQAVIFDCDGTLSAIEGIDELARQNHTGDAVAALTASAMGKTGISTDLYRERLQLTQPTKHQVDQLGEVYREHMVPDVEAVIQILQRLNKKIFIASAGLKPAVDIFASTLKIPASHVFAVDIQFDAHGHYLDFDYTSPLTSSSGKCSIAKNLIQQYQTIAHIGDGMNDFVVYDLVTRFIGFGGVFYRKNIEEKCQYYLKNNSMTGCLPLLLTHEEAAQLQGEERRLFDRGMTEVE